MIKATGCLEAPEQVIGITTRPNLDNQRSQWRNEVSGCRRPVGSLLKLNSTETQSLAANKLNIKRTTMADRAATAAIMGNGWLTT